VAAGRGAKGGMCPRWHFPGGGISRKIKKIRHVYGHLNALQLSISVHQRCSVAFKMHQIHIRPVLRPIRTLGSSPHSLVGWDLGQGGATGRTFAPGATNPCAATERSFKVMHLGGNRKPLYNYNIWPLIVTFALSSTVSEILPVLYAQTQLCK